MDWISFILGAVAILALILLAAVLVPLAAWLANRGVMPNALFCDKPLAQNSRRLVSIVKSVLHILSPRHRLNRRKMASRFRQSRERQGLTRAQLADRMGVSEETVREIERGDGRWPEYYARYALEIDTVHAETD